MYTPCKIFPAELGSIPDHVYFYLNGKWLILVNFSK